MALSVRVEAQKRYRNLQRRVPEPDAVSHLNITPMMDMMTILLLFFLQNFTLAGSIQPTADMIPPRSISRSKHVNQVQVTITKKEILVENNAVAQVKKGEVDSSLKRDGQSGFLITPLMDTLQKHATRLKLLHKRHLRKEPFDGQMLLIADQQTPYRLISEVLYSAGQAEFGKYRLVVLQN